MSILEGLPKEEEKKIEEKKPVQAYGVKVECSTPKCAITAGSTAVYEIMLTNTGTKQDKIDYKLNLIYGVEDVAESPEWNINLSVIEPKDVKKKEKKKGKKKEIEEEFERMEPEEKECVLTLNPGEQKKFKLEVTAPRGAKYGNRVDAVFTAVSRSDPAVSDSVTITTTAKQTILAVKTGIGYEKAVADAIAVRAKSKKAEVFAILSPPLLRGYLFVECMSPDALRDIIKGVHKAHGVVEGETSFKDIEHFLVPKPLTETISEGDIVELVAGPFKGEKARVQRVDPTKEEITVELFEAMVPIPITVRSDHVRVMEKA
jgi:transcriptional antiterminator NusG